jgi:phosphopantothenoylcysteine decarboxylase / phosphopantothenate---cysteine ligase
MSKSKKILIGLTGSIACYKTCQLISQLTKEGHDVQIVATPSALKFVGEATLEGLSQKSVLSDSYTPGHMMDHINLARWADIFVIAPLSANHVGKFANGIADDLLSTLYLAYERQKPIYLAPAMNSVMYAHPAVQENLNRLKSFGAIIIEPTSGLLACGETGPGRMAEPEQIYEILHNQVTHPKNLAVSAQNVLITYGGTQEPIDGVRAITNLSTGQTGQSLADKLSAFGYNVEALCSTTAPAPHEAKLLERFTSHNDLEHKIKNHLSSKSYKAVIHLAAVSDYSVDKIVADDKVITPSKEIKIGTEKSLTLLLKPNSKIVNSLKSFSENKDIQVIAFKLTNTKDAIERSDAIEKLLHSPGIDIVVHNDLSTIDQTRKMHSFHIYGNHINDTEAANVQALANKLSEILQQSSKKIKKSAEFQFEVKNDFMS